jgi:hypothetical protein
MIFWVQTPCSLADGFQSFGRTYYRPLLGKQLENVPLRTLVTTYKIARYQNSEDYTIYIYIYIYIYNLVTQKDTG